jgi:hypothetical protein
VRRSSEKDGLIAQAEPLVADVDELELHGGGVELELRARLVVRAVVVRVAGVAAGQRDDAERQKDGHEGREKTCA